MRASSGRGMPMVAGRSGPPVFGVGDLGEHGAGRVGGAEPEVSKA